MLTNYFSHDSNARNDEKIIRLRMKYKAAGYGVYFMILERMREEDSLMCARDYELIAFDLHEEADLIKSVVEDFGLFTITADGKFFYSESLQNRMQQKEKLSNARSMAGKKAMQKRWQTDDKEEDDNEAATNPSEHGDTGAAASPARTATSNVSTTPIQHNDPFNIPSDFIRDLQQAGAEKDEIIEAYRISDGMQQGNFATTSIQQWLDNPQKKYHFYEILQLLQDLESKGTLKPRYNYIDHRAILYIRSSPDILEADRKAILNSIAENEEKTLPLIRNAILYIQKQKGKIQQPGKFILKQLTTKQNN